MNRLTNEQRLEIVKIYYQNSCSVRSTFRALRNSYGRPSEQAIRALMEKFEQHFTLLNLPHHIHVRPARTDANIVAVRASVRQSMETSINRRSQELGLSRSMITDFFWPEIEDMDLDNMWFQQDGASSHTAHQTIDLLREKFGESIISRNSPIAWPPRSCDLTPLDFFLWGYVKSQVYGNKPRTLNDLKTNIERVIAGIRGDMLKKVVGNWVHRIRVCRRSRGGHLNDVLFRT